ncbi:hypothetical protein [uncultured Microbulbifer sp.]|uniref:hypothetical protein n=1 Tax=uncultured Microbulbifer sp. TaxID=348147 RepID=UPI0025DE9F1B|nr:hypothetical protein [uncultured Microbulbifer sp.]
MTEKKPPKDAHLNPDLHAVHDDTYGPDQQGHDPMENVHVTTRKSSGWPLVWAFVVIACVLITLYIFFA